MRKSKIDFYHKQIGNCAKLKDLKKTWSLINSLITGKNDKSTNNSVSNSKLIAESFNEYFVNIGPSLATEASEEVLAQHTSSYENFNPSLDTTFRFHSIDVNNIVLALMNHKVNKSTGLDTIPAKVLRLSADIIAPSLRYIFTLSLYTGIYIDEWKRARVIPVCKSEDRRKCENYRPISILSI